MIPKNPKSSAYSSTACYQTKVKQGDEGESLLSGDLSYPDIPVSATLPNSALSHRNPKTAFDKDASDPGLIKSHSASARPGSYIQKNDKPFTTEDQTQTPVTDPAERLQQYSQRILRPELKSLPAEKLRKELQEMSGIFFQGGEKLPLSNLRRKVCYHLHPDRYGDDLRQLSHDTFNQFCHLIELVGTQDEQTTKQPGVATVNIAEKDIHKIFMDAHKGYFQPIKFEVSECALSWISQGTELAYEHYKSCLHQAPGVLLLIKKGYITQSEAQALNKYEFYDIHTALSDWHEQKICVQADSGTFFEKPESFLIHWAVAYQRKAVITRLLAQSPDLVNAWCYFTLKARLEKASLKGPTETALMRAIGLNHLECAELLLKNGANTELESHYWTGNSLVKDRAIHYVHSPEAVELLNQYGTDLNAKGTNNETVLHRIAGKQHTSSLGRYQRYSRHHPELFITLLRLGARLDTEGEMYLQSPLHIACERGNTHILMNALITPAETEYEHTNRVVSLRNLGTSPNAALLNKTDCCGRTALHAAARGNNLDAVKILCAAGQSPDKRDLSGNNLLQTSLREVVLKEHRYESSDRIKSHSTAGWLIKNIAGDSQEQVEAALCELLAEPLRSGSMQTKEEVCSGLQTFTGDMSGHGLLEVAGLPEVEPENRCCVGFDKQAIEDFAEYMDIADTGQMLIRAARDENQEQHLAAFMAQAALSAPARLTACVLEAAAIVSKESTDTSPSSSLAYASSVLRGALQWPFASFASALGLSRPGNQYQQALNELSSYNQGKVAVWCKSYLNRQKHKAEAQQELRERRERRE